MVTFNKGNLLLELTNAKYTWCPNTPSVKSYKGEWHRGLFQKRITFVGGTAYFINIDQYNRGFYLEGDGLLYEVSIQTESKEYPDVALNFSFNPEGMTIAEVEELVKRFFEAFGSDYE